MSDANSVYAGVNSGLAGLKDLFQAKQEMLSSGSRVKASESKARLANNSSQSNKSDNYSKINDNKINELIPTKRFLPFSGRNVVYAELVYQESRLKEAKLYVAKDNRLVIYSNDLYADRLQDYLKNTAKLLKNTSDFKKIKIGDLVALIRRSKDLTIDRDNLIYNDEYLIATANRDIFESIKDNFSTKRTDKETNRMIDNNDTLVPDQSSKNNKEPSESHKKSVNHDNKEDLVSQITKIQAIARKVKASEATPIDAMEAFLVVSEASASILVDFLDIDNQLADSLLDQLRRHGALGVPNKKGIYPILIEDLDLLNDQIIHAIGNQTNSFRDAVSRQKINGKVIKYDLDELCRVSFADEYMIRVADFCKRSGAVDLSSFSEKEIGVSKILQQISGDDDGGINLVECNLYHQYVTSYMIASGFLLSNPTDGYPWLEFQAPETDGLRVSTLRYLLKNLSWIEAIYDDNELESLRSQLENMSIEIEIFGSEKLRKKLINKIDSLSTDRKGTTKNSRQSKKKTVTKTSSTQKEDVTKIKTTKSNKSVAKSSKK